MVEKVKKFFKRNILGIIIGGLIFGTAGVYAATYFPSGDVTYDNTESGLSSTDVQSAIDELYNACKTSPTGGDGILDNVDIVTSGDGLYKDEYEEGKYIYKGTNPNNYITFNNEHAGWRIISIEKDGTIKIMRENSIGTQEWDSSGSNAWSSPASLNTYLNGTYYNGLTSIAQSQIVGKDFSIGAVTYNNNDIKDQVSDENSKKWYGKIALPTLSEYFRTNSNTNCKTYRSYVKSYNTCKNTTWMYMNDRWWTLSSYEGVSDSVFGVYSNGDIYYKFYYGAEVKNATVRPVLYLSPSVQITDGDGSESNPFILK